MEKNTQILLVVCVILVAVLSLSVGMLIAIHSNTPLVVNTTNNTTPTVNTTVTQNKTATSPTKTTSSNGITANQASTIALKYGKSFAPEADWSVGM